MSLGMMRNLNLLRERGSAIPFKHFRVAQEKCSQQYSNQVGSSDIQFFNFQANQKKGGIGKKGIWPNKKFMKREILIWIFGKGGNGIRKGG